MSGESLQFLDEFILYGHDLHETISHLDSALSKPQLSASSAIHTVEGLSKELDQISLLVKRSVEQYRKEESISLLNLVEGSREALHDSISVVEASIRKMLTERKSFRKDPAINTIAQLHESTWRSLQDAESLLEKLCEKRARDASKDSFDVTQNVPRDDENVEDSAMVTDFSNESDDEDIDDLVSSLRAIHKSRLDPESTHVSSSKEDRSNPSDLSALPSVDDFGISETTKRLLEKFSGVAPSSSSPLPQTLLPKSSSTELKNRQHGKESFAKISPSEYVSLPVYVKNSVSVDDLNSVMEKTMHLAEMLEDGSKSFVRQSLFKNSFGESNQVLAIALSSLQRIHPKQLPDGTPVYELV